MIVLLSCAHRVFTLPICSARRSNERRTSINSESGVLRLHTHARDQLSHFAWDCTGSRAMSCPPGRPQLLGRLDSWSPGVREVTPQVCLRSGTCRGRTESTVSSVCNKPRRNRGDKRARGIRSHLLASPLSFCPVWPRCALFADQESVVSLSLNLIPQSFVRNHP